MKSIWNIATEYDGAHKIDSERCRRVVLSCGSIAGVRRYLEQILKSLESGDCSAVTEAQSVATPLAYRLAIDDTAKGYRVASRLKEAMLLCAYPDIMKCVQDEISWISSSAYGTTYTGIEHILMQIVNRLEARAPQFGGVWRIYGRRKSASSILTKLAKLNLGTKLPKSTDPLILERLGSFLTQFERQVLQRVNGKRTDFCPYFFDDVKMFIPDLVGVTLQLTETPESSRNLGTAKSKYRSVYKKLSSDFPGKVYYGPAYSKAWHMNRMVCHIEYLVDLTSKIAFELFVRTDFDYFIGYGNYWRYKGVDLFATSSNDGSAAQREFIGRIRKCYRFGDVQNILYREVVTGQLSLF